MIYAAKIFYKCLLLLRTYLYKRIKSKYPSAHMRWQGISASLRLGIDCGHIPHTTTGLVSTSQIRGKVLVFFWLDSYIGSATKYMMYDEFIVDDTFYISDTLSLVIPSQFLVLSHHHRVFVWRTLLLIRIN